ncbi:MAG: DUF1292 domain-containing protein [Ruminococcaceae bacterium]|nr:DUF1292 domain-containing protein [Oscillospiraceae bacterium]
MFENEEVFVYTLTDDEGNESDFEMIGSVEVDGKTYCALIPYTEGDEEPEEYIVLRVEKSEENPDEDILVSIDDDEEFDRIADIFDDEFADIDYDMAPEEE